MEAKPCKSVTPSHYRSALVTDSSQNSNRFELSHPKITAVAMLKQLHAIKPPLWGSRARPGHSVMSKVLWPHLSQRSRSETMGKPGVLGNSVSDFQPFEEEFSNLEGSGQEGLPVNS